MAAELLTPVGGGADLHLPPEICRDILTRLPVKSILRFRSVRKSWYSLVSCPDFISDHSNLNKNPNRVLLHYVSVPGREDGQDCVCSFSSHDKSFMESHEHDEIPESFLGGGTLIVGSCNGLICLKKYEWTNESIDLLIWNPTIRKIVELPSRTYAQFPSYLGFGFDSKTSDYKVLLCSPTYLPESDMIYQIFDVKKGVWRVISPQDPDLWHFVGNSIGCYLDGVVYWCGLGILLSFNFSDECFREISMPVCAWGGEDPYIHTNSVMFGGFIYVITFSKWMNHGIDLSKGCSVWIMKEYGVAESWTKVFDIDLQSPQGLQGTELSPDQFFLWENGEVLLVYDRDMVLYNIGNRKSECIFSFDKRIRSCLWLYEESLVLM